jgi:hypothetical protein
MPSGPAVYLIYYMSLMIQISNPNHPDNIITIPGKHQSNSRLFCLISLMTSWENQEPCSVCDNEVMTHLLPS